MQYNHIQCARAISNNFVNVCSSAEFYSKQIRWCIETVSNFWTGLPKDSRLFPQEVPGEIRFCLSWILDADVTTWQLQTIYSWLCSNLGGVRHCALNKLKGISIERLTHPSSIHVLMAPPPIKYHLDIALCWDYICFIFFFFFDLSFHIYIYQARGQTPL